MLILIWCQSRYPELGTMPGSPLGAKPAYQVSPVYDHSTIFTPLPTNSQAVSHLAGKKTLARFWYTGLATVSHRAPFHHIHPPCCLRFLPNPVPIPIVSRKARKGIGSFFSRVLDAPDKLRTHGAVTLREQELFSELDDCGRINTTTCRTNSPGMPTPEQARRGGHGAAGSDSLLQLNRLTCCCF